VINLCYIYAFVLCNACVCVCVWTVCVAACTSLLLCNVMCYAVLYQHVLHYYAIAM
jgi:hypothetical protein